MNILYLEDKIKFAIDNKIYVIIESKKGIPFYAYIYRCDGQKLYWGNIAYDTEQETKQMRISNIERFDFPKDDEAKFKRHMVCRNKHIEDTEETDQRIKRTFEYYKQILNQQMKSSENDSESADMEKSKRAIESKIKLLDKICENAFDLEDNLLLPFLTGSTFENHNYDFEDRPILILSNSNASQKGAIENSLSQKVSLIEGPPGTGKTTTILSIIANLLYRKKRIAVVSKNNSAIDNIAEEINRLDLPQFYVRLGNSEIMTQLFDQIVDNIKDYQKTVESYCNIDNLDINKLNITYDELKIKEGKLSEIAQKKNELDELINQKRHLDKRQSAYGEKYKGRIPFFIKKQKTEKLKKTIDEIAKIIEKYGDDKRSRISFFDKIKALLIYRISIKDFLKQLVLLSWDLEKIYLSKRIDELQLYIEENSFNELKKEIKKCYKDYYCPMSINIFKKTLYEKYRRSPEEYQDLVNSINFYNMKQTNNEDLNEFKERGELIKSISEFFPLVLSTADSLPGNFYDFRNGGGKFDYIILDEATQCDIISGIPLLFYTKNCIVSGDSKQLSAITGDKCLEIDDNDIDEIFKYYNNDFLNATKTGFKVIPILLREHYRCDYNIINFCNKFFYDDQLIIFKPSNRNSMQIVDVGKGKYAYESEHSFVNEREIYTIKNICNGDLSSSYVITPFKGQKNLLKESFNGFSEKCGTIHSFQGRGKENIYFSTVLNDLDFCNNHLNSEHNLFTNELVNVAVSRAKDHFILVTDKKYFSTHSKLINDLINYIDKYGEEIPDKTVCLFDYLYKQMPSYNVVDNCDNPYELKIYEALKDFCIYNQEYSVYIKLPLADLITDKTFLDTHNKIKRYVLNKAAHVDFTIKNVLGNPVLAIELDGKYHRDPLQEERDRMKNQALNHMGIPLKRINSKNAFSKNELISELGQKLIK